MHSADISIGRISYLAKENPLEKQYYFAIFAHQRFGWVNWPAATHTWALFYQIENGKLVDSVSISWNAAAYDIALWRGQVPGNNFGFKETFELANRDHRKSTLIHFARSNERLFVLAKKRAEVLDGMKNNGKLKYRMLDTKWGRKKLLKGELGAYVNCIHSVSDTICPDGHPLLTTGWLCGDSASKKVADYFKSYLSPASSEERKIFCTLFPDANMTT